MDMNYLTVVISASLVMNIKFKSSSNPTQKRIRVEDTACAMPMFNSGALFLECQKMFLWVLREPPQNFKAF